MIVAKNHQLRKMLWQLNVMVPSVSPYVLRDGDQKMPMGHQVDGRSDAGIAAIESGILHGHIQSSPHA